jgi:hypothetical protein
LNDFAVVIAQEGKLSAQSGPKCRADLRQIDAHDHKLAIIDRQLFLKFHIVAQLHLTFSSPVAPIESDDQRKLPGELRNFNQLAVMIGHFKIWKPLSNGLVHNKTS